MSHNKYLAVIASAGVVSWMAWLVVLFKLDPKESTGLALGLFYISLFFALTSTFTLTGYYLRLWFNRNEVYYDHINVSLRQAVLLSVIALGCLTFQLLGILTWWLGLLFIGSVTLVELYFLARQGV